MSELFRTSFYPLQSGFSSQSQGSHKPGIRSAMLLSTTLNMKDEGTDLLGQIFTAFNQCCGSGSSDPRVFGPPGSGSISQRYGSRSRSGSGSFCHQAKIVRKTLIPIALWLIFYFLSFVAILVVTDENSRIRIRIRIHLSEAWMRRSGSRSTPKCHGSATLLLTHKS